MKTIFSLIAGAVLVSSSVSAEVTSIQNANAGSKGRGDPNQMICDVEQTTGTRLGARKVCKTRAEWAQLRTEHRESLEMLQRMGTSVGCQEGQTCVSGNIPH